MEGKYSLKHLYNNGKSSQMKPQEFIDMINWLDQNADGMIGEAVEVTEKIDGSSNFIGYDGKIYVEKFGFDKKFYDESDFDNNIYEAKAKALLDFAHSIPDLEDYLEDLCNDNDCSSVKVQIEVLMTQFTKDPSVCQIVLVPYQLDKLGKDGNGFIIQVLNGDTLKPVEDEKIAVDTLCDILSTENFHVTGTNPKQFTPIDIREDIQEVKDIISDYTEKMGKSVEEILTSRKRSEAEIKKALKAEIEGIQEALQDKLSEAFPEGDYGEYYEGLVFKLTNGMMFKVTSKKFKQFIAEHNHWSEALENKYGRLTETSSLEETINSNDKIAINNEDYQRILKFLLENSEFSDKDNNKTENEKKELITEMIKNTFYTPENTLFLKKKLSGTGSSQVNFSTCLEADNSTNTIKIGAITPERVIEIAKNNLAKFEDNDNYTIKDDNIVNKNNFTFTVIFKGNKFTFKSSRISAGGKDSGICIIKNNNSIYIKVYDSKAGKEMLTSTAIQECVAGMIIFETKYNSWKGKSWEDIKSGLSTATEDGDFKTYKFSALALKEFEADNDLKSEGVAETKKNRDKGLFNVACQAALNGWDSSMESITNVNFTLEGNSGRLEKKENVILFHPDLTYTDIPLSKKKELEQYLFTGDICYKSDNTYAPYRDEVNPSDIYLISKKDIDSIIKFFRYIQVMKNNNIISQLEEQIDNGLSKNTAKALIKILQENAKTEIANTYANTSIQGSETRRKKLLGIKLPNTNMDELIQSLQTSDLKDEDKNELKERLALIIKKQIAYIDQETDSTTSGSAKRILYELCRAANNIEFDKSDDCIKELFTSKEFILTLFAYGKKPIPGSVAYATIHNFLTRNQYIAGISLKKLFGTGHFTFTGNEQFFMEDLNSNNNYIKSSEDVMPSNRNVLKFTTQDTSDIEKDVSTIKDVQLFIGGTLEKGGQGRLHIDAKGNFENIHGYSESKYSISDILSLIRSNTFTQKALYESNNIIKLLEDTKGLYTAEIGLDKNSPLEKSKFENSDFKQNMSNTSILTLDVRSAGENTIVIESGVEGSGAQGGKATHSLEGLVNFENISINQKFSEIIENAINEIAKNTNILTTKNKLNLAESFIIKGDIEKSLLGIIRQENKDKETESFLLSELIKNDPQEKTSKLLKASILGVINKKIPVSCSIIKNIPDIELKLEILKVLMYLNPDSSSTHILMADPILEKIYSDILSKNKNKALAFKITLLLSKALKYPMRVINPDDTETVSETHEGQTKTFNIADYFDYRVNNSIVGYYKLS